MELFEKANLISINLISNSNCFNFIDFIISLDKNQKFERFPLLSILKDEVFNNYKRNIDSLSDEQKANFEPETLSYLKNPFYYIIENYSKFLFDSNNNNNNFFNEKNNGFSFLVNKYHSEIAYGDKIDKIFVSKLQNVLLNADLNDYIKLNNGYSDLNKYSFLFDDIFIDKLYEIFKENDEHLKFFYKNKFYLYYSDDKLMEFVKNDLPNSCVDLTLLKIIYNNGKISNEFKEKIFNQFNLDISFKESEVMLKEFLSNLNKNNRNNEKLKINGYKSKINELVSMHDLSENYYHIPLIFYTLNLLSSNFNNNDKINLLNSVIKKHNLNISHDYLEENNFNTIMKILNTFFNNNKFDIINLDTVLHINNNIIKTSKILHDLFLDFKKELLHELLKEDVFYNEFSSEELIKIQTHKILNYDRSNDVDSSLVRNSLDLYRIDKSNKLLNYIDFKEINDNITKYDLNSKYLSILENIILNESINNKQKFNNYKKL